MTVELKSRSAIQARCRELGKQRDEREADQKRLRQRVNQLTDQAPDIRNKIFDVERKLKMIEDTLTAIRTGSGRFGVPGTVIGEVTAYAIELATRKDALERSLSGLRHKLAKITRTKERLEDRLENVEVQLGRVNDEWRQLDCRLADGWSSP